MAILTGIALSPPPEVYCQPFPSPYIQDFNAFPMFFGANYLGWEGPANSVSVRQNFVAVQSAIFDGSAVMNMRNREIIDGVRQTNFLISPGVTITGADAIISWVEAASTRIGNSVIWPGARFSPRNLWISVDGGTIWTSIDSYTSGDMPDATLGEGWRRMTYSLAAYNGQTIRWKWEMISEAQADTPGVDKWEYSYWCIDNVYIGNQSGDPRLNLAGMTTFGTMKVSIPNDQTFNITNKGPGLLHLQSISLTGSSEFSILSQPTIYPVDISWDLNGPELSSAQFKVRFRPTSAGTFNATLVIGYNGTTSSFSLDGQGIVELATFKCADAIPITDLDCSTGPPAVCTKSILGPQEKVYIYTATYDQDVFISSCDPHNTTIPYNYCYDTWLKVYLSSGCPFSTNPILLVDNDDQASDCGYNYASSAGSFHLSKNQTVYIYWPLAFPESAHALDDFVFTINVTSTCKDFTVSIAGDELVYRGYDPKSSATLIPTVGGGQEPMKYLWSTGETTSNIKVRPVTTTEYSLTAIDALGCTSASSFTVQVMDVRCGEKLDKVLMCKKDNGKKSQANAICVAPSAVPAQLKTGATLGACIKSGSGGDDEILELENPEISVYPNPSNGQVKLELKGLNGEKVSIEARDVLGRVVYSEEVDAPEELLIKSINLDRSGIYFISVKNSSVNLTRQVSVIK